MKFRKSTIYRQWLWYAWQVLRYEPKRVLAWKRRYNPITGEKNSWVQAFRATIENPPFFDSMWDDEIEHRYKKPF